MILHILLSAMLFAKPAVHSIPADSIYLQPRPVGYQELRILSPTCLELYAVTEDKPGDPAAWNFVDENRNLRLPDKDIFAVTSGRSGIEIDKLGYKRRVLYATRNGDDLRVATSLLLTLKEPLGENATVQVKSQDPTICPVGVNPVEYHRFRRSEAIHISQAGYVLNMPKSAVIGYYLGSLGELKLAPDTPFHLVDAQTGETVYTGVLKRVLDKGFNWEVNPYQHVYQADFSDFTSRGTYRVEVPGLGVSRSFPVGEEPAGLMARAYAQGLYHQRCGTALETPYTRFIHDVCHTEQAYLPTGSNGRLNERLGYFAQNWDKNPRHTAKPLDRIEHALYPPQRSGRVDATGGHHDAADYGKYAVNSARFIHSLIFAADNFPGVAELDNLGIPESGDGISDILQIAKYEADFSGQAAG